jgi:hypothetical protein
MTAVLAVLLVLGAVVLCAVAWHTRGHERPGVPDQEAGALTAWDPAELREWTLELHHTKSTPPWPPLPHPKVPGGGQDGGQLLSRESAAPWRGSRADHQEAGEYPAEDQAWLAAPTSASHGPAAESVCSDGSRDPAAGDPPMPAPSHPETWTDYHGPWTTRKVRADDVAADPVADLTGAAERIRALSLDEYEAAFPGWEHGTGWFRAIDDGEVA